MLLALETASGVGLFGRWWHFFTVRGQVPRCSGVIRRSGHFLGRCNFCTGVLEVFSVGGSKGC